MKPAERAVAAALSLAVLASFAFIAAYVTDASSQAEGAAMALAFAALAAALVGWAFWILPPHQAIDVRDSYPSSAENRVAEAAELRETQRDVTRRSALVPFAAAALSALGLALIVPLRSLAPVSGLKRFRTKWRRGTRLIGLDRQPIRAASLNPGSFTTVFPEGSFGNARSTAILVRLRSGAGIAGALPDGYIAYSKVCTHAGCPVALYRAASHELMCPCHQSVFSVDGRGAVLSGPADRPLPQLPLELDAAGYVIAGGDFTAPIGPGFWEMRNG